MQIKLGKQVKYNSSSVGVFSLICKWLSWVFFLDCIIVYSDLKWKYNKTNMEQTTAKDLSP